MGCGASTTVHADSSVSSFDFSRRNTIVKKPEVAVEIGEGVKKLNKDYRVVFIFGGPGSTKGSIVNDLVKMFDFVFISAETLILKNLPQKIYEHAKAEAMEGETVEPVTGPHGISKAVAEYPSLLSLEYVLSLVAEEVKKHPKKLILIDLIPNLKFLLRVKTFIKNCDKEMADFENQFPCAFALNMTLTKESLLENIRTSHACIKPDHAAKPGTGQTDGSTDKGDEMDTGRTQRRFKLYENSVKDFLEYFGKANKIVKVDTSSAKWHLIWEAIKDFFAAEMDFNANKVINTVILFTFDEESAASVDTSRYPMKHLILRDLVDDPNASAKRLLSSLAKQLDRCALQSRSFLVDLTNTSINKSCFEEVINVLVRQIYLDVCGCGHWSTGLLHPWTETKNKPKEIYFPKKGSVL